VIDMKMFGCTIDKRYCLNIAIIICTYIFAIYNPQEIIFWCMGSFMLGVQVMMMLSIWVLDREYIVKSKCRKVN